MMPTLRRRLATAAVTLASAAGTVTLAAPAAHADTLNCLADVYAVQLANSSAVQDDIANNPSAAAAEDAGSATSRTQGIPTCYYNPDVPYSIYLDISSGFGYVSAAQSENTAGQTSTALSSGRTAATYLNTAVTYLESDTAP